METLIIHPQNKEQLTALKAIAKAFKIDFQTCELSEKEKVADLYGKEAVASIEQGEEDIKAGRLIRIKDVKNIWESIL
jgi:predicted transcriptional regulator